MKIEATITTTMGIMMAGNNVLSFVEEEDEFKESGVELVAVGISEVALEVAVAAGPGETPCEKVVRYTNPQKISKN